MKEVESDYNASRPTPSDPLLPVRLHNLPKYDHQLGLRGIFYIQTTTGAIRFLQPLMTLMRKLKLCCSTYLESFGLPSVNLWIVF